MLKYVGQEDPEHQSASPYTIFTKDNKWTEPKQDNWRLRFIQNSDLLTSADACSNGELRIKEIKILTFDGWKLWTGPLQNYFTLVKHNDIELNGETTSSFSLTVSSEKTRKQPGSKKI